MSRKIIIGDVHGCHDEMLQLLEKLNWDPSGDRLIFAGDLVDRGPKSAQVVQWVRKYSTEYPEQVSCVLGNHDDKHFRYFKHALKKREHPNYRIPMRAFNLDKLQVFNSLDDEDLDWLGTLPNWIWLNEVNYVVAHAGLEPSKSLMDQDNGKVNHIRYMNPETRKTVSLDENYQPPPGSVFWTDLYDLPYNVVYGHNVYSLTHPSVITRPNGTQLVGIDTGCCFGGRLTAFLVPEGKTDPVTPANFVQVQAKKAYSKSIFYAKE